MKNNEANLCTKPLLLGACGGWCLPFIFKTTTAIIMTNQDIATKLAAMEATIARLAAALEQVGAMSQAKGKAGAKPCPWLSAEEAALLLGMKLSASNNHRRRLSTLIDRGLIVRFREGKPRTYWREEIEALAARIAAGQCEYY